MSLPFMKESESVWVRLQKEPRPIVMYGTGNGADKVFDVFERYGITVSGVTASSAFVRNRTFHGFQVEPFEAFKERFRDFVTVVTFGSSLPEVMNRIIETAEHQTVLVPCVPVVGTEVVNEEFLQKYESEMMKAYGVLAEQSKEVFADYYNFLFSGKLGYLRNIESDEREAWESLDLSAEETYIDIGAYKGDTVEKFLNITKGKYCEIIAVEPDRKTFAKLEANCGNLPRFKCVNAAVTDETKKVEFSSLAGRQSAIGKGAEIDGVSLADLCEGVTPTYIKIDSEGEEENILLGGKEILKQYKPKLNVAAYHKSKDVFSLINQIKEANENYEISVKHHPYIPAWDTVLYCK